MADVPNAAAPAKAAAKGIKGKLTGHKPIVYVAMAVGIIAIAIYMRKRNATGTPLPTADATGTDNSYDDSYYPDGTQGAASIAGESGYVDPGAYGGYPTPDLGAFFDELTNFVNTATQTVSGRTEAAAASAAATTSSADIPSIPTATGGGITQNPSTAAVHSTPPPVQQSPVYQTGGSTSGLGTPSSGGPGPVAVGNIVSTGGVTGGFGAGPAASPSPAPAPAPSSPYGSRYPFHSDRGWYRLVTPPGGGRWHYYGPNDNPKVRVG